MHCACVCCLQVTNDFSFVFCAVGHHPLRPVEPESLREAVQYLAAHRCVGVWARSASPGQAGPDEVLFKLRRVSDVFRWSSCGLRPQVKYLSVK